jgi:cysteine-rich repeat protein
MSSALHTARSFTAFFLLVSCGARTGLERFTARAEDDAQFAQPSSDDTAAPSATLFIEPEQPAILLPAECGPADAAPLQPARPSEPAPPRMGPDSDNECGNSRQEEYESCDDGNLTSGDGCDEICRIEPYYVCITGGEVCIRLDVCGDGSLSANEECDDGNLISGDACSPSCQAEVHCSGDCSDCTEQDSSCIPTEGAGYCGDGIVQSKLKEVCDHGGENTGAYEGCTPKCTLAARCGDMIVQTCGQETCDDGNRVGGDGCNADCQREQHWVR